MNAACLAELSTRFVSRSPPVREFKRGRTVQTQRLGLTSTKNEHATQTPTQPAHVRVGQMISQYEDLALWGVICPWYVWSARSTAVAHVRRVGCAWHRSSAHNMFVGWDTCDAGIRGIHIYIYLIPDIYIIYNILVYYIYQGLKWARWRIGHTLDLVLRSNELRNVWGAGIGPSVGTGFVPYTWLGVHAKIKRWTQAKTRSSL